MVWQRNNLYIIEKTYIDDKGTAEYRISLFNGKTHKTRMLYSVRVSHTPFAPNAFAVPVAFDLIGIGNGKWMLLQMPGQNGTDNYRIIKIDLLTGKRQDIFSFKAEYEPFTPHVNWIDTVPPIQRKN